MAKKGTITSLLMSNPATAFAAAYFRVGDNPLKIDGQPCADHEGNPVFPPVTSIKHCKHEFGAGALVRQPCYAIAFEDSPETVVIPATQVAQVTIITSDAAETANVPAMPTE